MEQNIAKCRLSKALQLIAVFLSEINGNSMLLDRHDMS